MASIAPWSIRSIETFALWAGELWRAALGSFFDVQCRGLPLLSLRSSKRARSDQHKDAVASTNGASEMASVYWLRFILVVRRHFIMIHCVLIIVSFFSRHIRDHLKLFLRPADRASKHQFLTSGSIMGVSSHSDHWGGALDLDRAGHRLGARNLGVPLFCCEGSEELLASSLEIESA